MIAPMTRFLLTAAGALLTAFLLWAVCGFASALLFTRLPGGAREGGGAMAGFFVVGPLCALIGLAVGGWSTWRLLEAADRTAGVLLGLGGIAAFLAVFAVLTLSPRRTAVDDFQGRRAELCVELSTDSDSAVAADPGRLTLELRSGAGSLETRVPREQVSRAHGITTLRGVFPIRQASATRILAIMQSDRQVMSATLQIEGSPVQPTDWSDWQEMEAGWKARWRLAVSP
jgi:MFS family permease